LIVSNCRDLVLVHEARAAISRRRDLGVPTVLVYLGFRGDDGIADAGEPIRDASHWREVFARYAYPSVPQDLFERRLDCGAAPVWFLIRSRNIIQVSPPRSS
jgi:hypothetical protein